VLNIFKSEKVLKNAVLLNDEGALLVSDYFLRENVARDNMFAVAHTKKINYLEIAKNMALR